MAVLLFTSALMDLPLGKAAKSKEDSEWCDVLVVEESIMNLRSRRLTLILPVGRQPARGLCDTLILSHTGRKLKTLNLVYLGSPI